MFECSTRVGVASIGIHTNEIENLYTKKDIASILPQTKNDDENTENISSLNAEEARLNLFFHIIFSLNKIKHLKYFS